MAKKFKVGDWVKVIKLEGDDAAYGYKVGTVSQVIKVEELLHNPYLLSWDVNRYMSEDQLEFSDRMINAINNLKVASGGQCEPKPMNKLNSMMKRLLDADTKKLLKAGLINGDLLLTENGRNAIWAILVEKFKPELLAEADEIIAEEKE